jgi:hypothetical protein
MYIYYYYVATSLLLNFVGTQSSLYSQENHLVRVLLLKDRVIFSKFYYLVWYMATQLCK